MKDICALLDALRGGTRSSDLIALRSLSEHEFERLLFPYREEEAEDDRLLAAIMGQES